MIIFTALFYISKRKALALFCCCERVELSILLLDEKFKMLRFISCVTRPAHSAPGPGPALLPGSGPGQSQPRITPR